MELSQQIEYCSGEVAKPSDCRQQTLPKVITGISNQTSVHWDGTVQSTVSIPRK